MQPSTGPTALSSPHRALFQSPPVPPASVCHITYHFIGSVLFLRAVCQELIVPPPAGDGNNVGVVQPSPKTCAFKQDAETCVCDFQLSLSVSNEVWRGKLSQILSSVFSPSITNQRANSIPNHRANSIQPRGAPMRTRLMDPGE